MLPNNNRNNKNHTILDKGEVCLRSVVSGPRIVDGNECLWVPVVVNQLKVIKPIPKCKRESTPKKKAQQQQQRKEKNHEKIAKPGDVISYIDTQGSRDIWLIVTSKETSARNNVFYKRSREEVEKYCELDGEGRPQVSTDLYDLPILAYGYAGSNERSPSFLTNFDFSREPRDLDFTHDVWISLKYYIGTMSLTIINGLPEQEQQRHFQLLQLLQFQFEQFKQFQQQQQQQFQQQQEQKYAQATCPLQPEYTQEQPPSASTSSGSEANQGLAPLSFTPGYLGNQGPASVPPFSLVQLTLNQLSSSSLCPQSTDENPSLSNPAFQADQGYSSSFSLLSALGLQCNKVCDTSIPQPQSSQGLLTPDPLGKHFICGSTQPQTSPPNLQPTHEDNLPHLSSGLQYTHEQEITEEIFLDSFSIF